MEIRNVEITNFHQKNACQKVLKIPMVRMMCFTTSLRVRLNLCNTRSLEAIGIRSQFVLAVSAKSWVVHCQCSC